MRTVLGVWEYIVPAKEALENKFLPKLLGLESISRRLSKLLLLGAKMEVLGILSPT